MSELPAEARTALEGLRALGGDGLLKQMVGVFVEHSRGRVEALDAAAAGGDFVAAAAAAHTLKGSARQLALGVLADACLATEQTAKTGNLAGTQANAAAVHAAYTTAAEWLAPFMA